MHLDLGKRPPLVALDEDNVVAAQVALDNQSQIIRSAYSREGRYLDGTRPNDDVCPSLRQPVGVLARRVE